MKHVSEPTNQERARRAKDALAVFTATTFSGDHPDTMDRDDLECAIGDLICDLMRHWRPDLRPAAFRGPTRFRAGRDHRDRPGPLCDRNPGVLRMTARCQLCGQEWPRDPALEVPCPACHAPAGKPCKRPSGHACSLHAARDHVAMAAGKLNRHPPADPHQPLQLNSSRGDASGGTS